jgi:signal transduction histidine kinase
MPVQKQNAGLIYLVILILVSHSAYPNKILLRVVAGEDTVKLGADGIIHLEALHNDVLFEFAPLVQGVAYYEFKLDGFDSGWTRTQYPTTRYTNLSGDEYRFVVRLHKGKTIVVTESIPVSVEKELQEEFWFIPAVVFYIVLLISAAIYFFLLYNFRQKLKMQSMRYKIASDLHDEVGATLSSIAISTRLVRNRVGDSNPEVKPILDRIKSDSEDTIHTIRDTVWAINPDNDAPEKLFEKMRSFGFQLLSALDIALEFDNSIPVGKKMKISMEQRRNIFLMFKEAINNIAKHSGASKVHVSLLSGADGLKMIIEDNGKGFNTDTEFEGNGLKSFRHRAQESFMDLQLSSIPGKGTRIEVEIPEI